MYRPQIKVLDCTIRDGGLLNNSKFSNDFVKQICWRAIYGKYRFRSFKTGQLFCEWF